QNPAVVSTVATSRAHAAAAGQAAHTAVMRATARVEGCSLIHGRSTFCGRAHAAPARRSVLMPPPPTDPAACSAPPHDATPNAPDPAPGPAQQPATQPAEPQAPARAREQSA